MASLYREQTPRASGTPPEVIADRLERLCLLHPWTDAELPSLVYEGEGGEIVGFLGRHVRRASFDGEPIRMAVATQFVSAPAARRRAPGAVLLKRFLAGPQDVSLVEGVPAEVRAMWEPLGGHLMLGSSVAWVRPLRPAAMAGYQLLERIGRPRWGSRARPLLRVLDAPGARFARPVAPADQEVTRLTPEMVVDGLDHMAGDARLLPAYDKGFLRWLFGEMEATRGIGTLVRHAVHASGELLGWYVAYVRPDRSTQVLQIAARRQALSGVLYRLFVEAWQAGSSAVTGRLDAPLLEPLWNRCLMLPDGRMMVHSPRPEILTAIALGQAWISRLEGEGWMVPYVAPAESLAAS